MEPISGFLLYFVMATLVSLVAGKRGLNWWAYMLGCFVVGILVVVAVSAGGGSEFAAASAALTVPICAFVLAMASNTSEREAVVSGSAGEYKKCQFCAEAVRKEAIKCRHCGSSLVQ